MLTIPSIVEEVLENTDGVIVDDDGTRLLSAEACGIGRDVWDALPRPRGWYIAVLSRKSPTRTKGGIHIPEQVQADRSSLDYLGRVVAMGASCYRHEDFMVVTRQVDDGGVVRYTRELAAPRCKLGDWVIFMRHEQLRVPVYPISASSSDDVVEVRFTTDRAILAAAASPERLKVYIA